jgi:hypothetical protein
MKKYIFLVLVVLFLVLPFLVKASVLSEPLVQCGTTTNKTPCTLCDVFKLVQRIINFISYGLFILAPIFIVYGGIMILLAGAKPSNVETGKNIIKNAIIGVIIALLAWTVINEMLIVLASPKGSKVGTILGAPWNVIECTGGGVNETPTTPTVTEGEYCACEAPVYDLDPVQYPNNATEIGRDIKITKLADKDTCKTGCVIANADTYCPTSLKKENSKLYCGTESDMKSKTVCQLKVGRAGSDCQISTGKCWDDPNKCADSVVPGTSEYNASYANKCFLNGKSLCGFNEWAGGNTYCPGKDHTPCPAATPYTLYRFAQENQQGNSVDALTCSNYNNSGSSCRLDCKTVTCTGGMTKGTCKGSTCSDSSLDICGQIADNCDLTEVGKWNSKIDAAAKERTKICPTVDSVRMVKAIMAEESSGNIKSISKDKDGNPLAGGLMQLLPVTANQYKSQCGVSENIDFDWLTNSVNAEKQICIAIEYMKTLVGSCGCSVKNIAAGYNGGGGKTGACDPSTNCGSAAKAEGGECLACSGEQVTRRWQCLWDDNAHTKCNVDNPNGSFNETRKYAPKVDYCYDQFR